MALLGPKMFVFRFLSLLSTFGQAGCGIGERCEHPHTTPRSGRCHGPLTPAQQVGDLLDTQGDHGHLAPVACRAEGQDDYKPLMAKDRRTLSRTKYTPEISRQAVADLP